MIGPIYSLRFESYTCLRDAIELVMRDVSIIKLKKNTGVTRLELIPAVVVTETYSAILLRFDRRQLLIGCILDLICKLKEQRFVFVDNCRYKGAEN